MKKTWIYSEDFGSGVFNIAHMGEDDYRFVWIDKHSIANIFKTMADYTDYVEGNLNCERECVAVEPTDIEGYDTLDQHLNMEDY
jgi:hypothetical protein